MKKTIGLLIVLILAGLFFFNKDNQVEDVEFESEQHSHSSDLKAINVHKHIHKNEKKSIKPLVKPNQEKAVTPPFKPKDKNEESLKKVSVTFKEAFENRRDSKTFKEDLKELNLSPTTNLNSNPYTGSMAIIRTKKNLTGTRYIHAQYVSDGNGNEGLQHLSFEYRPGPNALQRTDQAIRSIFGIEAKPVISNGEFISYKLGDEYIIWLKRMGEEDLKDDPFNAYTKNDVGTIRVAIELEIHGEEHDSHVFPDGN